MATQPVLEGTTLAYPYDYEEQAEFRGASVETADASVYFDLAQTSLKHLFTLRFRGLTTSQRTDIETAYTALKSNYTTSNFTAPTGTTYTVTRDPAQKELRWQAQPVAGGTLYWQTELRLREV